jgi:hypothetical protein
METSTRIRIIDYHLKERIEGQNSKITLSGSNIESWTLVCLTNRHIDPPWINRGTPKE